MPHFSELSAFNMGVKLYYIHVPVNLKLFCIFRCSYPFSSANIFWAMQDNLEPDIYSLTTAREVVLIAHLVRPLLLTQTYQYA